MRIRFLLETNGRACKHDKCEQELHDCTLTWSARNWWQHIILPDLGKYVLPNYHEQLSLTQATQAAEMMEHVHNKAGRDDSQPRLTSVKHFSHSDNYRAVARIHFDRPQLPRIIKVLTLHSFVYKIKDPLYFPSPHEPLHYPERRETLQCISYLSVQSPRRNHQCFTRTKLSATERETN